MTLMAFGKELWAQKPKKRQKSKKGTNRPTNRPTDRPTNRPTDRPTGRMYLAICLFERWKIEKRQRFAKMLEPVWGRWTCPTRQLRATTISPSFKQFPFIFAIALFNLVGDIAQAMLLSIINLSSYQPLLTLQVPEKFNCKRKSSGTRNQF